MQEEKKINEILSGCKRSDPFFQKELVTRFAPMLMTVARRFCRDIPAAEDVLQEGFILIFKNINSFNSEIGSFEAWLRKIIINTALKHIRKSSYKFELPTEILIDERNVMPDIMSKLSLDEILKLINTLPPGYKEVFNLYVFDDYSHEEIAELLGIAQGTSRSQLARARKLLQEQVQLLYNEVERI